MPAGRSDSIDHFGTQFVGKLAKLAVIELAKIGWRIDGVEQRRGGMCRHVRGLTTLRHACR